jgi:ferric-dicitrate binding protein FerR (iron transport regulator)
LSLRDAVARYNRANAVQIVIDDPALLDVRLGGRMSLIDVEAFVAALRESGIAAVEVRPDESQSYRLSLTPSGERVRKQSESMPLLIETAP